MTMPVAFSQTEPPTRTATPDGSQDRRLGIQPVARRAVGDVPFVGIRKQSATATRSPQLGGNPGFEKWNSADKDGELNLVVASGSS